MLRARIACTTATHFHHASYSPLPGVPSVVHPSRSPEKERSRLLSLLLKIVYLPQTHLGNKQLIVFGKEVRNARVEVKRKWVDY
eukprot:1160031-Pelagomonas_calceolata.AAC.1